MRVVLPGRLWIGHAGDVRRVAEVLAEGVRAFVDLAAEEPPAIMPREMLYLRFPLLDGEGNPSWLLNMAVQATAKLIRAHEPTLVFCGAGMSRSPAMVASALSQVESRPASECLADLRKAGPCDISPGLWRDMQTAIDA